VETGNAARVAFGSISSGAGAILKAVSGGGGKGIRHIKDVEQCDEAFERCASEASRSFGDGTLLLERFVPRARHIEVQLLVDSAGGVAHLGDRDCSIQRNFQKIIEIAPAPLLHADLRAALHRDAVRFGQALVHKGLRGLATVEFLLDADTNTYYFMECNPRLQVEATITEQISGVDLVCTQLHLVHGTPLSQLFSVARSAQFCSMPRTSPSPSPSPPPPPSSSPSSSSSPSPPPSSPPSASSTPCTTAARDLEGSAVERACRPHLITCSLRVPNVFLGSAVQARVSDTSLYPHTHTHTLSTHTHTHR
jgi:hypothetical protein